MEPDKKIPAKMQKLIEQLQIAVPAFINATPAEEQEKKEAYNKAQKELADFISFEAVRKHKAHSDLEKDKMDFVVSPAQAFYHKLEEVAKEHDIPAFSITIHVGYNGKSGDKICGAHFKFGLEDYRRYLPNEIRAYKHAKETGNARITKKDVREATRKYIDEQRRK